MLSLPQILAHPQKYIVLRLLRYLPKHPERFLKFPLNKIAHARLRDLTESSCLFLREFSFSDDVPPYLSGA